MSEIYGVAPFEVLKFEISQVLSIYLGFVDILICSALIGQVSGVIGLTELVDVHVNWPGHLVMKKKIKYTYY